MLENIIQEYLVGLGVKIDRSGFNELQSTIGSATKTIESATRSWRKDFVEAAGIVVTALAGITTAVAGTIKATANQDLAMEKLARNMMVSKEAAWEMKKATDALGESINDIAITPELMERYTRLVADGRKMKVGGDFEQTMRGFRDLMFEFTRLKQEVSYAMTWVGYYLLKYLNRPLAEAQARFRSFNDMFIRNMSGWTEKAARAIVYIINVGAHFLEFIKNAASGIYNLWDAFPKGVKKATAALAGFFALIRMSPLGRLITLVSTLLLLIDDYFGYFEGKDALFGKYWEKVNLFIQKAKDGIVEFSRILGPVLEQVLGYAKVAADNIESFGAGLYQVFDTIRNSEAFSKLCDTVERLGKALYYLGSGIVDLVTGAVENLKEAFRRNDVGEKFVDLIRHLYEFFLGLFDAVSRCIDAVAGLFSTWSRSEVARDFADAVAEIVGVFLELIDAVAELVKTVFVEFFHDMNETDIVFSFGEALKFVLRILTALIRVFSFVIKKLTSFLKLMTRSEVFQNFWRNLGRTVKEFGKIFDTIIGKALDKLGKFGRALKCLINGDFKGAVAAISGDAGGTSGNGVTSGLTAAERAYEGDVQKYSAENSLDPNLVRAIIKTESSFNNSVVSDAGAVGLMQLTPEAVAQVGGGNPYDPSDNIRMGTAYLKWLDETYAHGDKEKLIKMYNAGPGGWDKGYRETEDYYKSVMDSFQKYASRTTYKDGDVVGGQGSVFRDDSGHIVKWSSNEGMHTPWDHNDVTDTSHFQPRTVEALNALLAEAYNHGYHYVLTGGSEGNGYHAGGAYSHENGYKFDISDDLSAEEVRALKAIVKQFGGTISHESDKNHYDITIKPLEGDDYGAGYGNSLIGNGASIGRIRTNLRRARHGMRNLVSQADPILVEGAMAGQSTGRQYGAANTVNTTYQIQVGDVNVASTNADPRQIGQAVADKTLESLNRRGRYILQNRTLTGGQNLV